MSTDEPSPPLPGTEPTTLSKPTVLVVEDEDTIRTILRITLQARGFNVLAAGSGEEALELSQGHAAAIDLVITDLLMPGITGSELVAQLIPVRPSLHVIYISGYPGPDTTLPSGGTGKVVFVPKPFTPNQLMEVVRNVLG